MILLRVTADVPGGEHDRAEVGFAALRREVHNRALEFAALDAFEDAGHQVVMRTMDERRPDGLDERQELPLGFLGVFGVEEAAEGGTVLGGEGAVELAGSAGSPVAMETLSSWL
jgi:hypothetical protein